MMNVLRLLCLACLLPIGAMAQNPTLQATYTTDEESAWTIALKSEGNQVRGTVKDDKGYAAAAQGTWSAQYTLQLTWQFDDGKTRVSGRGSLKFAEDLQSFTGKMRHEILVRSKNGESKSETSGDWSGSLQSSDAAVPTTSRPPAPAQSDEDETADENEKRDVSTPPIPPTPNGGTLAKVMTDRHNYWRNELKLPPLKWSDKLAAFAQAWANELARRGCELEHRPYNGQWKQLYGENIYWTSAPVQSTAPVDSWASEKEFFDFNTLTCKGEWYKCGHYTQMIWEQTTELGCAVARCGGQEVWVCNYNPAGNVVGEKPYKKKK